MAPNKNGQTAIYRFLSRLVIGLILAIMGGSYLDQMFNTTPFILIGLLIYVMFGSLYLLVRELK
ncbi:MAG: hypothetical protein R3Y57_05835 [Erysipelotrichaceae bacterium]